jgi:cytochrome c556
MDIAALFPEGTDFGETKAKAEVWSDSEGFSEKSKQAADAAKAFSEAVKSGDKTMMLQAFKGVGDSCKGCHEAYRAE